MSDERTPSSSPGPPTALQQLEASLAAGHLTPELFATLSAQLPAAPAAPVIPPAAPKERTFSPRGTDEELPSLLDMFNQPPAAPVGPPPVVPPAPPAAAPAPPAPASLPRSSAADAAARQLIEERLAQIRQPPAPPAPASAPRPAPVFYSEPPAPVFYPTSPGPEMASPPPAQPTPPPPPRPSAPPAKPASSKTGGWILLLLLGLALAGGVAYSFIQNSHPDEALSSPSLPAADAAPKETAAPKPAKQTKKSTKKKRKKKVAAPKVAATESEAVPEEESIAANPPAAAAAEPASEAPATTQRSPAAAPEAGDDAATIKIRAVMAAYYADLFTPPLHASQHFAPQVERLYIQQNLTPAAIDAELARSFYPENQQAIARIEPGTLRVSAPAADGSRTATFTETMRLYRVSLKKRQQLRTKVRVRFNADNKIVYMRQEKLLANTFE
ncbi:hypothetical protein QMK33_19585 [Hymenobacter sp. H14-R3]|uniref:hypothetical protein n=1 Tax=Hymenobacter sp. H14-R3 TaxID=3046308 RepID=UPI0024B93F9A|nr:hypothetical protein [Hymenobacter sp. H14-R3]MDJ0367357.1 hypothetical protein [Hymenobacter sp. H14-R3]